MRKAILFTLLAVLMLACTPQYECEETTTRYYYLYDKLFYTTEETTVYTSDQLEDGKTDSWTYTPRGRDTIAVMTVVTTRCWGE